MSRNAECLRQGRRSWVALMAGGVLLATGCASVPEKGSRPFKPLGGVASKLSGKGQDEALRKKVESDTFPTAQQAGI